MKFFLGIVTGAVLAACGWQIFHRVFGGEELASKAEWSALQITEHEHRDSTTKRIEMAKTAGHQLVAIPAPGTGKKIWIMLNPRNPPYYKQLPQGDFSLSREQLNQILASREVSSTVEGCLRSHLASDQ